MKINSHNSCKYSCAFGVVKITAIAVLVSHLSMTSNLMAGVAFVPKNVVPYKIVSGASLGASTGGASGSLSAGTTTSELPSTDDEKKIFQAQYIFAYRHLVSAIFTKNIDFSDLKKILSAENLRAKYGSYIGKLFGIEKGISEASQVDVSSVSPSSKIRDGVLIKFPNPQFPSLPSYVAVVFDGLKVRCFSLERIAKSEGYSRDATGVICESVLESDSSYTHKNYGLTAGLYDNDAFLSCVKKIVDENILPINRLTLNSKR